jgi:hypothetical protein
MSNFWLALVILVIGLGACNKDTSGGGDVDAAIGAACSSPQHMFCAPAPGAKCRGSICGLDGLPSGQSCTVGQECGLNVDPCPDWQQNLGFERTDGYACTCVGGRWACGLCTLGEGECAEGGAAPVDASTGQ